MSTTEEQDEYAAAAAKADTLRDQITRTSRGFAHGAPIPSEYGGEIRTYESSAASHPHIWVTVEAPVDLNQPNGETHRAPAHLTVENATILRDQLTALIDGHYQLAKVDTPRPERMTLTDEERALGQQHSPHRWFREDAVERILAAREQALREEIANTKAEALRGQAGFFRSVDMLAAADMCEQSAIEWDAAAFDATRGPR